MKTDFHVSAMIYLFTSLIFMWAQENTLLELMEIQINNERNLKVTIKGNPTGM